MNKITTTQYLAAVSLMTVFTINALAPSVLNIDILYVCSIVLVFKQNAKTIVCFSIAAATLILINTFFFDPEPKHTVLLWINRLISLFAIFIMSYVAIHYRKQTQAGVLKGQHYTKALESMLFMMSHQVRKPVANILGLIETIQTDRYDLSKDDMLKLCAHLQASATELDTFIKALNAFIEQTERSTANSKATTNE